MSLKNPKPQPVTDSQPQQVPELPSYLASLALTPEDILDQALQDISQHNTPNESQFYVPQQRRQIPEAGVQHRKIVDPSIDLEHYNATIINPPTDTSCVESVVDAFFLAISQGNDVLVQRFLESDLLDASTPRNLAENGLTPLLCAVQHRQHNIVMLLMSHGAHVDQFGTYRFVTSKTPLPRDSKWWMDWNVISAVRTPLQLAAQLGDLDMVKLLRDEYHADDSLVAPDGQLALRLAKGNGHKEIVSYLPARRGGGYRRWKANHRKFMKRMRKSVKVLRDAGVIVFWEVPSFIVRGTASCVKEVSIEVWKNKHKFAGWCWRLIKHLWQTILKTPQITRKLLVEGWKCTVHLVTKTIPKAAALLWKFSKNLAKEVAGALIWIVNRAASFCHTLFHAIISAFKALTWTNVRDGFVEFVRAVFISIPKAFYRAIKKTIPATWKGLVALVKGVWWVVYFTFLLCLAAVIFVMEHLWKIISAIGGTTASAGKEVYVWVNPKG